MIETIDFNKSEQYTLSIRLSTDGFSFSIFNPLIEEGFFFHDHKIDESLSLTANLKQTLREIEWLKRPYRRVHILISGKRFTPVPLEYFEDEQIEMLFSYNHPQQDNELVLYNILRKNNIVVLFGMDKSAYTLLQEQYPNAKYHSQSSPLIELFSIKSRFGNSKKIYANLQNTSINLYCYDRGHLLLANSFACSNTADRIYYLLYTWKQLGFNQKRDELHLSGELPEKEALLSELRKYISQVFVMAPSANLDLQTIVTCE